jgi:ribosomal protein L37AE/L43A
MNCPKCGSEMQMRGEDYFIWYCVKCNYPFREIHEEKMKCPKCGSEMVDDVWPYIEGTPHQMKCLKCGHEEKVQRGKA